MVAKVNDVALYKKGFFFSRPLRETRASLLRTERGQSEETSPAWPKYSRIVQNSVFENFEVMRRRHTEVEPYLKFKIQRHLVKQQVENEMEHEFYKLKAVWKKDTAMLSSIQKKSIHPAYQRIIGMGSKVVPLLLSDLMKKPEHWFWALTSITGEEPVDSEDAGNIKKMAESWVEWGRRKGIV